MDNQKVTQLLALSDEDLYMHYNEEHCKMASDKVRKTHDNLDIALDECIAVLSEYHFAEGFRYAISLMGERTRV